MPVVLFAGGVLLFRNHAFLRTVSRHEAGLEAAPAAEDVHEGDVPTRRGPPTARTGVLPRMRAVSSRGHGILTI